MESIGFDETLHRFTEAVKVLPFSAIAIAVLGVAVVAYFGFVMTRAK